MSNTKVYKILFSCGHLRFYSRCILLFVVLIGGCDTYIKDDYGRTYLIQSRGRLGATVYSYADESAQTLPWSDPVFERMLREESAKKQAQQREEAAKKQAQQREEAASLKRGILVEHVLWGVCTFLVFFGAFVAWNRAMAAKRKRNQQRQEEVDRVLREEGVIV